MKIDIDKMVAQGKSEILEDIKNGRVPSTVGSFGELHDYVDANWYGGLFDLDIEESNDFDAINKLQDTLNVWIVNGMKD
jgi:hypothetical protein